MLTNFSDTGEYNYLLSKEEEESYRDSLRSYANSSEDLQKGTQAFEEDLALARMQYTDIVASNIQSAMRLARELQKTNAFEVETIQVFLRASTMHEWRYLSRYLDAPEVCLRGINVAVEQTWEEWLQKQVFKGKEQTNSTLTEPPIDASHNKNVL